MRQTIVLFLLVVMIAAHSADAQGPVVHYTFDRADGDVIADLSGNGHDGMFVNAELLDVVQGRAGVLRFSGDESILNIADPKGANPEGDMTFEMWVRRSGTVTNTWATLFGDVHDFCFYYAGYHSLLLWYTTVDPVQGGQSMLVPVRRDLFGDNWSHIAVVVEYPRCRFYHNGALVRDAYLPVRAIANRVTKELVIGKNVPMDIDEFRLYDRALSADEIAAHVAGRDIDPPVTHELAVEPNWYDDTLTLRFVAKNEDDAGRTVTFTVGDASQSVAMESASSRFAATATFPLNSGPQTITATLLAGETVVDTLTRDETLTKPNWIHSREGYTDVVPIPWTPVEVGRDGGATTLDIWARRYTYADAAWPSAIEADGESLLTGPITLVGRADGKPIAWADQPVELVRHDDRGATLRQQRDAASVAMAVESTTEYDGYSIIECTLTAKRDVSLDELTFDVPLDARYAKLCYGDHVLSPDPKVPINEWYSGAVTGDLAFRVAPTIWLGAERRGLVWQTETDEPWRNADPQRAIEILPNGDTTTFRAHFVDQTTQLKAGDTLTYKFAHQATPIKPLLRDAWDLRIVRYEPYGAETNLPDRTIDGQPAVDYFADAGVRHLLTLGGDLWPYPMPVSAQGSDALRRLNDWVHAHGLKLFDYQLHQRFPTAAPEFELYGAQMAKGPIAQYLPGGNPPGNIRRGPVDDAHNGSNSQGTIFVCPKSMALQDAYVHAVGRRLDEYGDDGIYLDGTCHIPPCQNFEHGCGYIDADGKIHKTYPVFAVREYMRRIYVAVKQRNPDNVVDLHCSWGYNPAGLAYADCMWTGEQWYHLRHGGSDYIAGDLSLEQFRTEFTGWPVGIAADTLHYRLGPQMKVAAISLLHDVPVRASTAVKDEKVAYFDALVGFWALRDRFDAAHADKLFYFENQRYVQTSPEKVYATLLKHPTNGVLALISNLHPDAQTARVQFNLDALGFASTDITAINGLTNEPIAIAADGSVTFELQSHEWVYVWLQPAAR